MVPVLFHRPGLHLCKDVNDGAGNSVTVMQNITLNVKDGVVNVSEAGKKIKDILVKLSVPPGPSRKSPLPTSKPAPV